MEIITTNPIYYSAEGEEAETASVGKSSKAASTIKSSLGFMKDSGLGEAAISSGKKILQTTFGKKKKKGSGSATVITIADEEKKKKLSTGAIIGIVAGGLLLVGVAIYLVKSRNKSAKK